MNAVWSGIALVVLAAAIEGLAQMFLKLSRMQELRRSGWVALGLAAYAVEIALYTLALRAVDISVAFPAGALSFVFVTALSRWPLREAVGALRWIGSILIVGGAMLVALGQQG